MNEYALYHISDTPYAYAEDENTLTVRLRTCKNDLKSCVIIYKDRFEWDLPFDSKPMHVEETTELFDYYITTLQIESNRYLYYFRLEDNSGKIYYYYERGLTEKDPKEFGDFQFPYIAKADVYHGVDWEQEGIVYQIFPDRFCNGDKSNDPEGSLEWGKPVTPTSMFGGDLAGITKNVPYLAELGITLVYLNPIFLSSSNHKYNTDDYYQIDPHFGTLDDLKELVRECHKNNIRIILDAVFNHCGDGLFAFQDVVKKGEKSKFKDWFFIDNFPVNTTNANYYTFGLKRLCPTMPKFNTANEEVSNFLLDVTEYWMKEVDIDGWRLDVSDEVDHVFWRKFRKLVKSLNPNAIIAGEIQHEASPFLRGDQMDTIMNYPFKEAAIAFFANREINPLKFETELTEARMHYMNSINRSMFNLLDCHDTKRFLTLCDEDKGKFECATVFQFTYIGVPYIYYGDEVGMTGGYDPLCRACMIWDKDKQDTSLLNLFKKLCKIRKQYTCLVYGNYRSLSTEKVLAYCRSYKDDSIYVVINNNKESNKFSSTELSGHFIDLLTDREIEINGTLTLKADEYKILKPVK